MTDVVMPQMGESIVEGTLTKWLKKPGDRVERDEPLFEISTDKVDTEIPSPAAGTLAEVLVEEGKTVGINTVVARLDEGGGAAAAAPAADAKAAPAPATEAKAPEAPKPHKAPPHRACCPAAQTTLLPRSRWMIRRKRPLPRRLPPLLRPLTRRGRFRRWCARWRARTIWISAR